MTNALTNYASGEKTARTKSPQMERTPGRNDEVRNAAGGYVFEVSDRERLERFLILGTDGGTYYVGEQKLTKDNVTFVRDLIARNERLVVDTVVDVSTNNRAAKNTPAIFTLALVLAEGTDKAYARAAVNQVVRTGTHLFEFAQFLDDFGGWGRAKRKAIAEWYTGKDADQLAYQAVKYRQRNGWTHRDLFRKSHPEGVDQAVGNFILGKPHDWNNDDPTIIDGFHAAQKAGTVKETITVLDNFKNLPWEALKTEHLTDAEVWKKLFYNGQLNGQALVRQVTRLAKNGAFNDLVFAGDVAARLADPEAIAKGRVHPVAYANAIGVYTNGRMSRDHYYGSRSKDWSVNAKVAGGLEAGFYESFKAVEPANKATYLAIDVSASMTWGAPAGLVGLNYMEAAGVMAMVTLRTEPYAYVAGFSTGMQELPLTDRDTFAQVMKKISNCHMGGTDISAPMRDAAKRKLAIDTFAVYSDMETWAGAQKPFQALEAYRKSSGRNARLAAIGLASTSTSVADPKDKGSLNLVGFDANAPRVLADFSAGRI